MEQAKRGCLAVSHRYLPRSVTGARESQGDLVLFFFFTMPWYLRRALYVYVAASTIAPLITCGQDVPVAPNTQPNAEAHWQTPGHAAYGHHHTTSVPPSAVPAVPVHAPHGYVAHDPSALPHTHKDAALHKRYALWEQAPGSVELTSHSWQPPLAQDNISHWDVAMSTIPSEEHVLLIPGESNRTGQFWHRQAIPAEQIEVQFGFGVFGKDQAIQEAAGGVANGASIPEGFAFWYVYEPYANVYPRSPEQQASWNLIGYKSNPKGFGVIFKAVDRAGQLHPSISCIHNTEDGRALTEEIPSSSALFYQYRNQPAPVLFRVIVDSHGVAAQIRESVTSAWVTACSLEHVILRPHGFIGFTAHNKPASGQAQQTPGQEHQQSHAHQNGGDQVLLYFVKLWSLGPTPSGQLNAVPPHPVIPAHDSHVADPLHTHHGYMDHYGGLPGTAHTSPYPHPDHTHAEQTILRMLTSLGNQLSMLSVEISGLRHDVRRLWGDEGSDAVKSLKSELTGFKDLFKRHSQQHTSALHTIHKQVESKSGTTKDGQSPILSRLSDLSSQLEQGIAVRHGHLFLLSIGALVFLMLIAFCSWKKLRDIEKKHML